MKRMSWTSVARFTVLLASIHLIVHGITGPRFLVGFLGAALLAFYVDMKP